MNININLKIIIATIIILVILSYFISIYKTYYYQQIPTQADIVKQYLSEFIKLTANHSNPQLMGKYDEDIPSKYDLFQIYEPQEEIIINKNDIGKKIKLLNYEFIVYKVDFIIHREHIKSEFSSKFKYNDYTREITVHLRKNDRVAELKIVGGEKQRNTLYTSRIDTGLADTSNDEEKNKIPNTVLLHSLSIDSIYVNDKTYDWMKLKLSLSKYLKLQVDVKETIEKRTVAGSLSTTILTNPCADAQMFKKLQERMQENCGPFAEITKDVVIKKDFSMDDYNAKDIGYMDNVTKMSLLIKKSFSNE